MSWEHRLREMILAGGALAAVACTDNAGSVSDASPSNDADIQPDAVADAFGNTSDFCCNANPDPCCPYLSCGARMTAECNQEVACEAEGGTWDYSGDLTTACSFPRDAAPSDAPSDVDNVDGGFCCNANPDPCCSYLHCGGPMTATCNQEIACQADGGTWAPGESQPDGSTTGPDCSASPEAGPSDAALVDAGADAHD